MTEPTRREIAGVIDQLLAGAVDREAASLRAGSRYEDELADPLVEEALDVLVTIDAWQVDHDLNPIGYMYDFTGLEAVRAALRSGSADE